MNWRVTDRMLRLTTDDLSLGYDGDDVVRGVSLTIPSQEITTLIGPNGSGKSTLLKGMARLLKPRRGAALLNGQPIHRLATRQVAKQISVLAQQNDAPGGLLVRELVAFGRFPHRNRLGFSNRDDTAAITRAMDIVGIRPLQDCLMGELSGGQQQLAWIAMTLAQEAPIMLLDEPTTYLDLAHQLEVLDVLKHLRDEHQRTIVLVLHDINLAARYSDYLVALREGRVIHQGSAAEVMTRSMLEAVFSIHGEILHDPLTGRPLSIPTRSVAPQQTVTPTPFVSEGPPH